MKRFVFDALCIFMIVLLGRSFMDMPESKSIDEQMEYFNNQIANHKIIETPQNQQALNQIEENWAG